MWCVWVDYPVCWLAGAMFAVWVCPKIRWLHTLYQRSVSDRWPSQ